MLSSNFILLVSEYIKQLFHNHDTNLLVPWKETLEITVLRKESVCCENHTEHTDTLYGQDAEFWYVRASGTYTNQ
jgi:hypothetical protein